VVVVELGLKTRAVPQSNYQYHGAGQRATHQLDRQQFPVKRPVSWRPAVTHFNMFYKVTDFFTGGQYGLCSRLV
jgi:hypothetical protein